MPSDATPHRRTSWFEAIGPAIDPRPALDFGVEADVCVIGGGLAGLHVALEVARKGWSVVVLEAGRLASGASGANAGLVHEGFDCPLDAIEAAVGLARSKALRRLSRDGVTAVQGLIEQTRMPGVDLEPGVMHVTRRMDGIGLREEADRLVEHYGAAGIVWSSDRLGHMLRSPVYTGALFDSGAFSINPLAYSRGLATECLKAGARIYEETPALDLDLQSIRRQVRTPRGSVRCDHIVLACAAPVGAFAPFVLQTTIATGGTCAVTEPLEGETADLLMTSFAARELRRQASQFRRVDGNRLLWCGPALLEPDAGPVAERVLRSQIANAFPALARVRFEHIWQVSGHRTRSAMPRIGSVGPSLWLTTGFGGHGINTAAVGGLLVARAITERNDTIRLFEPYLAARPMGRIARWREGLRERRDRRRDRADERRAG